MASPKPTRGATAISDITFRELFDLAADCMLVLGSDGVIREINRAGHEQLGYTRSEMVGARLSKFISPEYAAIIGDRIAELQEKGFLIYESAQVCKDGTVIPVEISSRTFNLDGQPAFFSIVRNITERKLIEQALQQSEHDLKEAQSIAHFGSWTHDMAGHITWSDELYKIFGVSPETFTPNAESFSGLIHPGDLAAMQAWNQACALGQKPGPIEWRCIRPDGSVRHICGQGELILDARGRVIHMAGTVQDITEQKKTELKYLASEEKWRLLFENMTTGFALHDVICDERGQPVDYRFVEINPAYERLTGLKAGNVISRTVLEVLPGTEPYWIETFGRVALTGEPTDYENYSRELGRWYQVRAFSPKIGQFAVIVTDITDRKQLELAIAESEKEFRQLAEAMPQIVWITRADGWNIYFNQQWVDYTGLNLEESHGHGWNKPFHPDDKQRAWDAWQEAVLGEENYVIECRLRRADGEYLWWLIRGVPVFGEDGRIDKWFGTCTDINEIKMTEQNLLIAATAFESQESLMITDANGVIIRVNNAFTESTGYTPEEVVGKSPRLLKSGRHNEDFYRDMWKTLLSTGKWQGEIWDRRKNGEVYPKWLAITAVKDSEGKVTHYVGSHIDITERKAAEEEIQYLAFYDPLTRLPNRRLLLDRLNQALVSSARSGRSGAVLFIDLDNFKNLNDTLGHDIGDMLLQQVTQRLEACIRTGDTVARLGGDEFVVMLLNMSKDPLEAASQAEVIGEKILGSLGQTYQLAAHSYHCTASIGVTLFGKNQQSTDDLMKQADIAMYQAKKAGRNALRFFDRQMQENISARVSLENELHNALEFRQFHLYYQIQVDSTRRPLGAEALIRWIHPQRGLVSPAHFIPLAEESGLILPVGQWVLETACARIREWEQEALMRDLVVAVNVSAKQFRQPGFVAQVQSVVQHHRIDPSRLKLELTEGMLLEDIEETIATMNALNEFGVKFSLDDFGTGYSSLQYLKRLPLDQIKIDQSFVRDVTSDPNDAAIVQTIIAMAETLGLDVVAEGVETRAQFEFLELRGCNRFQGYLFGRPVPIEQFEAMIRQG